MLPHEVDDLLIVENKDYATLITCTPYGVNTHRLLIRGHRIPYEEKEKEMISKPSTSKDWMVAVPIFILVVPLLSVYMRRRKRKKTKQGNYAKIYR